MRDHTLMKHSNMSAHKQVWQQTCSKDTQNCHSCCVVDHHLFLRRFCCFYLQMLSRSQQACIWPAICFQPSHGASCHQHSLALSSTVHVQAQWGYDQPDTIAPEVILQVSDAFLHFPFNYLTTSQQNSPH